MPCQEPRERSLAWARTGPKGKDAGSAGAVDASQRTGETVETNKKIAICINISAQCTPSKANKLDENKETIRQEAVFNVFRTALQ